MLNRVSKSFLSIQNSMSCPFKFNGSWQSEDGTRLVFMAISPGQSILKRTPHNGETEDCRFTVEELNKAYFLKIYTSTGVTEEYQIISASNVKFTLKNDQGIATLTIL